MDNKEIIRMAREAGFDDFAIGVRQENLERFAALVAAHAKSEQINLAYQQGYEEGSAHEREACAKVCEELINEETCYVWIPDARGAVNNCAAAIRARGDK